MDTSTTELAQVMSARECGHACAVASQVQRDLQDRAQAYPDLFPARPFDAAFFSTIALANTFCAPWVTAQRLRAANRITMWIFGVDRLMDHLATSRAEIDEIVTRCLAVADGGPAPDGDPLAAYLAEIRDELATAPAFAALGEVWRVELRRMLASMARDWEWKAARAADPAAPLPTLDAYLEGAEFGYSLVYVSHWIFTTDGPVSDVDELLAAGREVQRVIRLLNDFGTYHRDVSWGDVSALLLGVPRDEVSDRLEQLIERCRRLLAPLGEQHRPLAVFLERHIDFNRGFYGLADYWGQL